MPSITKLSKFLSLVLRHKPDTIGLSLDEGGWAEIDRLVEKAGKAGMQMNAALVRQVVATSDKQRFCISPDGTHIRANQGHSIPVELMLNESQPPDLLYHGTAIQNIRSIRNVGIRPEKRNYVHLSPNAEMAFKVGGRHGKPVVLTILAADMFQNGIKFFLSENGIWLTDYVAPEYLIR
ncbi:MAG: RNA 2'-phosphotransferase [Desulfuromonadaceae bacterium]|nr:RNA 2'-phosphotransferase [Desulfuromonadaceae bacterium]